MEPRLATEAHSEKSIISARIPLSLHDQQIPSPHGSPALTFVPPLPSAMFRHDRPLRCDPVSRQVTVRRTSPARRFRDDGSRSSGTCVDHFPFRETCQNNLVRVDVESRCLSAFLHRRFEERGIINRMALLRFGHLASGVGRKLDEQFRRTVASVIVYFVRCSSMSFRVYPSLPLALCAAL